MDTDIKKQFLAAVQGGDAPKVKVLARIIKGEDMPIIGMRFAKKGEEVEKENHKSYRDYIPAIKEMVIF